MADNVKVHTLMNTKTHIAVLCTSLSDGTGESAVVKVDKSTLVASDGSEPAALDLERVEWSVNGMAVSVFWDHTTDDLALHLTGQGKLDLKDRDYKIPGKIGCGLLKDPRSAGDTGDILFTTVGHSSGDGYNILMVFRKQPD